MWQYSQSSGELSRSAGSYSCSWFGYSGAFPFSWPDYVVSKGPIPLGKYTIGKPTDEKGPLTLPLTPDPSNAMHSREGFLIHAENASHPAHSSEGCIIQCEPARQAVVDSQDYELEVVA